MRDPKERLRDLLEPIAAIERHLHRGKAAFEKDELLHALPLLALARLRGVCNDEGGDAAGTREMPHVLEKASHAA